MSKYLVIQLGQSGDLTLKFLLRQTELVTLWLERMNLRHNWALDHRDRFYNCNSGNKDIELAVTSIKQCISTINSFEKIIDREFEFTQDHLNYLHHIFEVYHGLLDQQTHDFWIKAPDGVKRALAELNIAVHRCESVNRGQHPRFVCTWFGMPKTKQLNETIKKKYGESSIKFGSVYLNYCEIGKTLEDLTIDDDKYISDDAFKPFGHYSADFNVQFGDRDLGNMFQPIQRYIEQHMDFFLAQGITSVYNVHAKPLRFPIADLEFVGSKTALLDQISQRQWVYNVYLE
jgi:hypothetical protein